MIIKEDYVTWIRRFIWAVNQMPKTDDKNLPIMGLEEIAEGQDIP